MKNGQALREESARYMAAMREKLGLERKPIKKALPPSHPFNDDEYEEKIMMERGK